MSTHFYSCVRKFFHALDLDGDQFVTHSEAAIGFNLCFEAVHGDKCSVTDTTGRHEIIQSQVDWLFSAISGEDNHVTEQQFEKCYSQLLANAYEEEVLQIDLNRAINALNKSTEHQQIKQLLTSAQQYFMSQTDHSAQNLVRALGCVTGKSNTMGPKKQKQARAMVDALAKSNQQQSITQVQWLDVYFQMLRLGVSAEELLNSAQSVLNDQNAKQQQSEHKAQ